MNVCAIVVAVVGAVGLNASPLTAVQLLWVNLIMDAFASLALATEPPCDDVLERPPYGRNRNLISRQVRMCVWSSSSRAVSTPGVFTHQSTLRACPVLQMWFNIVGQSIYQLTVLLAIVFHGDTFFDVPSARGNSHNAPPTVHYTIVFTMFVLMQVCSYAPLLRPCGMCDALLRLSCTDLQ